MIRNLKALGLSLLAICALGAMAASSASAVTDVFTVDGKAWVTGVSHDNVFSITNGPEFKCTTSKYLATAENLQSHLTVTPTYTGIINETPHNNEDCTVKNPGTTTKIDMNGCDYKLTGTTTGHDLEKVDATVWVECPVGQQIKITATNGCTLSIPAQTPTTGGVTYTNTPANKVTIDITVTGITYSSNFVCQLGGVPAEANNANYTGTVVASGWEDKGGSFAEHKPTEGKTTPIEFS